MSRPVFPSKSSFSSSAVLAPFSKLLYASFTLTLLGACGSPVSSSQLKGHYENASPAATQAYEGKQRVPPEYSPSDGLIVSQSLVTSYGRQDIVKAAVDAGVKKIWVVVPKGSELTTADARFAGLRAVLGDDIEKVELIPQKQSGGLTIWARDWSPLGALSADGSLRLLDLNYYPYRPTDDAASQAIAGFKGIERVSVPVYNEGGNFMINGQGDCLMTSRVTDANSRVEQSGDMILDAAAIRSYYQKYAGCRSVHIFPRMPTERTGHIDMWAKFLDDDTVIVNQISEKALKGLKGSELEFAKMIQEFLEERASDIEQLGFNVQRIPMPAPRRGWFRSYSNSTLLNGTAVVPQYSTRYSDAALIPGFEAEARRIYQNFGYKVVFIPSDELIEEGGAVHCVTMQVPASLDADQ